MAASGTLASEALTRNEARKAEEFLQKRDPSMRALISAHGPCDIPDRCDQPFASLASAIISQQLSAKAAQTIKSRVRHVLDGPIEPKRWLSVQPKLLRNAGMSAAKVDYISQISRHVVTGAIDFQRIERMTEGEAISALVELPGVGRWTAEMFLIFCMKRPNVLPLADAGLRRAVRLIYKAGELEEHAVHWAPYCSVASWYLWRHLDS